MELVFFIFTDEIRVILCTRLTPAKNPPMLELFRNIPPLNAGVLTPPTWPFVKRGIDLTTQRVINYYRSYAKPVKSDHFLIRLLGTIAVPRRLPIERYYANVDAIALNVAMFHKMTSPIYKGKVFEGVFYGTSTPEILLASDDYFDFEEVSANWENACPITPLLHDKSDLSALIPTGVNTSDQNGLAVILINISMLAVQYRAFLRSQLNSVAPRHAGHFIASYVLPNMLRAHNELCLFNRINNMALGKPPSSELFVRHPFSLPDYTHYVDSAIKTTLTNISKGSLGFNKVLSSLPALSHEHLYEALIMPDMAPTRQCDWALVTARLKHLSFLIRVCDRQLLSKNQMEINQAIRALRNNDVISVMRETLPHDVFDEQRVYVDEILLSVK